MKSPILRFSEFKNDWEFHQFSDVTEILRCGIASTPNYVDEGIPFLSAQNVTSDGQLSLHKYSLISEAFYKKISKNNELKKGDLLYSRVGAGYGKAALFNLEGDYGVYVSLTHIRPTDAVDSEYLKQYLNSPYGNAQAKNGVVQGGGVPNLNVKSVEKFLIPLPTFEEQEKIGIFFKSLDQKIALLTDECKFLVAYKKGMMQKIFNQEIRFKDDEGNNFANWSTGHLSNFVEIQGGYAFSSKKFNKGQNKVLKIGDVYPRINLEKFLGSYSEESPDTKYLVKKNDFLIALSGATFGKVGKIIGEGSAYINQRVATFRTSQIKEFFFQLVQSEAFISYIKSIPAASAQPNISNADIEKYECEIPSLDEQEKIARFLSMLDEKISILQKQIDLTKQYKQGLLKQMFI